jgi:hypothetical protein
MSAVHFVCLQLHLYLMHSTLSDIGRVYTTLEKSAIIPPLLTEK